MNKRKRALLSAIGVLAVAYAAQLALARTGGAKVLSLKERVDSITIQKTGEAGGAAATLTRNGELWTVGSASYRADSALAESLADAAAKLNVLGTVSGGSLSGDEDRFGLADGSALEIALSSGGKTVRTIRVGKASPTGQQSYVRLDGKKEVLLVSGNLAESFGKTEGDFRDKTVYSLAADALLGVSVSGPDSFSVVKSGEPAAWKLAPGAGGSAAELDGDKTGAWVSSLASLRASAFLPDDTVLPASALATVGLDFGAQKVTVTILEKRADGEYLCASSESPSPFTVASYVAEKYLKGRADLAK